MRKNKELKRNEEEIKKTLVKLIERSKDAIEMVEKIDQCYAVLGQASDGDVSPEYQKEIDKRNKMKEDLNNSLNYYLGIYRKNFGEYKEL